MIGGLNPLFWAKTGAFSEHLEGLSILLDIFFERPDLPGFKNLEGLAPRENVQ